MSVPRGASEETSGTCHWYRQASFGADLTELTVLLQLNWSSILKKQTTPRVNLHLVC